MIQDPREGCAQVPLHYPGRRMEDRGEVGWGQLSSSQEMGLLCMAVVSGPHLGCGPFAHGNIIPFYGHCLLTAVEVQVVLPAVPCLVLAGETAVKRDSHNSGFGLDVFCHIADS